MQFYEFMMKKHLGKDTPAGDLAADMEADRESFPRNDESDLRAGRLEVKGYLESRGACPGCMAAFGRAWASYARFERRQKRKAA